MGSQATVWGGGAQPTLKMDTYLYSKALCPISFCNYKCLRISLFDSRVFFYTSICYQSQSIHTQPIIKVDTTPYILKLCLCRIAFCNHKNINICLSTIVISFNHSYALSRNVILRADGGLFLHPAALTGFLAAGLDFHS